MIECFPNGKRLEEVFNERSITSVNGRSLYRRENADVIGGGIICTFENS